VLILPLPSTASIRHFEGNRVTCIIIDDLKCRSGRRVLNKRPTSHLREKNKPRGDHEKNTKLIT
jgi:hypothetical protein